MEALEILKVATSNTDYEGRLYLVGGIVRDKILGIPADEDIDIVLEGDATRLAQFLFEAGIGDHAPVVYPRFGTAMIGIGGHQVEIASARKESYSPDSRKPHVAPASLQDDVLRRDFTINTLLENLHTGEVLDLTGLGRSDIASGIIRTPMDARATFEDDPLRMLRAIRFAARFGFDIEESTLSAIREKTARLSIISKERIREEFSKTLMTSRCAEAVELLSSTGLLKQFAGELEEMRGVTQNAYHLYDVWTHTLKALSSLPDNADLELRLAALFHDIGKPATRSVDDKENVHFYTHQHVGAEITQDVLTRLRYSGEVVARVSRLVSMHLRIGEYSSDWSDAAVRRLIRDAGNELESLFLLTEVDKSASNPAMPSADLDELKHRIREVTEEQDVIALTSPLNGREIMQILGIGEGPLLGKIKSFLLEEVIEGRLAQDDREHAKRLVLQHWPPTNH